MAIGFNQTKGSAQKSKIETYNYAGKEDSSDKTSWRLTLDISIGLKAKTTRTSPMERLSFDRTTETFNNKEHDHVRDFYPDLNAVGHMLSNV